jgi:hypothetical protein
MDEIELMAEVLTGTRRQRELGECWGKRPFGTPRRAASAALFFAAIYPV